MCYRRARMVSSRRVLLVGLDCAPPALVFDRWARALPVISAIRARGLWGPLRSTTPPVTVPAWASMLSGHDPGELGLYGFRNRVPGTRTLRTATDADVHVPRVWDVLAEQGKRSVVIGAPPSWPPPSKFAGALVSCLLTPSGDAAHTAPAELGDALRAALGRDYVPDVDPSATPGDEAFVSALTRAAAWRFDAAEWLLAREDPALVAVIEIGTDRLHHALWPLIDPSDPRYPGPNPSERLARDFYAYLDMRIGRLMKRCGEGTTTMMVSDHGARPVLGGVYVNEWLRRAGWLTLRSEPARSGTALEACDVDWAHTRATAEGGYYARVFLSVRGRDPDGIVLPEDVEAELSRLSESLRALDAGVRVVRPREVYRQVSGAAPDLMVFFGDLSLRALGTLGHSEVLASADEVDQGRGRGGCNHDWNGVIAMTGPDVRRGRLEGASIMDVGPTVLRRLGVAVPADWQGRALE